VGRQLNEVLPVGKDRLSAKWPSQDRLLWRLVAIVGTVLIWVIAAVEGCFSVVSSVAWFLTQSLLEAEAARREPPLDPLDGVEEAWSVQCASMVVYSMSECAPFKCSLQVSTRRRDSESK
jgi:hypothetical protein